MPTVEENQHLIYKSNKHETNPHPQLRNGDARKNNRKEDKTKKTGVWFVYNS